MVATLMSLRWALARREVRARPWLVVLYVLMTPAAALMVLLAVAAAHTLGGAPLPLRDGVSVTAYSVLTLVALLVILLFASMSSDLDPARFQTLPVDAGRLRPAFLLSMLVSLGGALTLLLTLLLVLVWAGDVAAMVAAVVAALLGTVLIALAGLTLTSVLAATLHHRRTRELTVVVVSLSGVVLGLGPQLLVRSFRRADGGLAAPPSWLTHALGWLPSGWAWAIPGDVAQGRWLGAAVRTLLSVALGGLLWWLWGRALDHALTSPMQASSGARSRRRRGGSGLGPAGGPVRAVLVRELRYTVRDSRRWPQILMMAVFPLIFLVTGGPGGSPWLHALSLGAVIGAGMTYTMSLMSLSWAGGATAADLASGMPGRTERTGVALAAATTAAPLPLAMAVAVLAFGAPQGITVLGMTLALLGISLGVGTYGATLYTVRMPPPGSNPFRSNTNSLEASAVSLALLAAVGVLSLPVVLLGLFGWHGGAAAWATLTAGVVLLAAAPAAGVALGGRRLDRRWPEILHRVS